MLKKYKITLAVGVALVIIAVSVTLAVALPASDDNSNKPPSTRLTGKFEVDNDKNIFTLDNQPFQYVSGSFHYFRTHPDTWKRHLRTMRAAGLNVVDTYVYWALHNPHRGQYNWDGMADLEQFIRLAAEEDLYVILRPGPYICAEIDNGGLPHWLRTVYKDIKMRTNDPDFMAEVKTWYEILLPKMKPYLVGNGGPIIMVQVENEYGIYHERNNEYMEFVRDQTLRHLDDSVLLFTTDIPNSTVASGTVKDVYATIDFGADRGDVEMDELWATMRRIQPNGPLVNSEYYPGWLTHWQEINQRRDPDLIAKVLRKMLEDGANVNIYMFFGGTNFGFTAGANDWGIGSYQADLTSYDYDAPMDEAGDPTEKYLKIRNVIKDFLPMPLLDIPEKMKKMSLPDLILNPVEYLLSDNARSKLGSIPSVGKLTFEELDQFSGLVLYETNIPDEVTIDPTQLIVNGLRDRAHVYIDGFLCGTLSRENAINSLPINLGLGKKLQILVENQGRINFNDLTDVKGITGSITLQLYDGVLHELANWMTTGFSFEDYSKMEVLLNDAGAQTVAMNGRGIMVDGPIIFSATFTIDDTTEILDTYIDPTGWGKGFVFINGFNLGRYWPLVGSQISLFLPGNLLKTGSNSIVFVEYQKAPVDRTIKFVDKAIWTS